MVLYQHVQSDGRLKPGSRVIDWKCSEPIRFILAPLMPDGSMDWGLFILSVTICPFGLGVHPFSHYLSFVLGFSVWSFFKAYIQISLNCSILFFQETGHDGEMFSEIDATDCKDNHASSKDGEDYVQCFSEIPFDNAGLEEICIAGKVVDTLNFGEDRKDVSYIVLNINFFQLYFLNSFCQNRLA